MCNNSLRTPQIGLVRKNDYMMKNETASDILNEMIRDGCPLSRTCYLAYMYGPPEEWPKDVDAALPDVLKRVSGEDHVGVVVGGA